MNHRDTEAQRDSLTEKVIGAAICIALWGRDCWNRRMRNVYAMRLKQSGLQYRRQVGLPVVYKAVQLDCGYRMDVVVENSMVMELKTVEILQPIHEAQLLTYLRLSGLHTGLLLNFNVPVLKNGIRRMKL